MKYISLLFAASAVIFGCLNSAPKIDYYNQVTPKITMEKAIEIASEYLNSLGKEGKYIKDSVTIWEWPVDIMNWYVSFKKTNWKQIKPSTELIKVQKITGKAEYEAQE
jgi:hypothetical protein